MIALSLSSLCLLPLAAPAALSDGLFSDLSVYDALAHARRSNQVVLVSWTREDDPMCKRMERNWEDPTLREWVEKHTVAVEVDGYEEQRQARNWNVSTLPAVLLIQPDGVVFLRVVGYQEVEDLLVEFDASLKAMRSGVDTSIERPTGDTASDPKAWLDYANALYAKGEADALECLNAYLWCLDNGDIQSPGFLERYLDLILRRAMSLDKLTPAKAQLNQRRNRYAKALDEGFGTPESVHILLSLCHHLGEANGGVRIFDMIRKKPDADPAMVETALEGVLSQLVAKKRYADVLEAAGDIVGKIRGEVEGLREGLDSNSGVPFPSELKDSRRKLVDRAGYYYEALLAVGRGADAKQVAEVVLDMVPTGSAYATFIGHAKRAEVRKVAEQLCATGVEKVDSEKGKKMITRALNAVKPGFKRVGKSAKDADDNEPSDG